jgi:uncharacterized protein YbjT (DUF2867 family)
MILVSGAAGKTGRAVIRALVARKQPVRALVFRQDQVKSLMLAGVAEVVVADLMDGSSLAAAMHGIRSVYHICPNMHPDEHTIGRAAIAAALSAGVDHFVYHSVLLPQVASMPHHWQKHLVEEELKRSRFNYTILQPCAYMQNLLPQWNRIVDTGELEVPYDPATQLSLVDLVDVAEVAAIVLGTAGDDRSSYELCGPECLSQTDMAKILTEKLKNPVQTRAIPLHDWEHEARDSGLSGYALDSLLKMFEYYDRHGFCGTCSDLERLLERPATTFTEFVHRRVTGNDDES